MMTSVEEMQGRDRSLCASSAYYMQTSLGTRGLGQEHKSERKLLTLCQSSSYSGVHRIRCARNSFSPQPPPLPAISPTAQEKFTLGPPRASLSSPLDCFLAAAGCAIPPVRVLRCPWRRESSIGARTHNLHLGLIHCVLSPSTLVFYISFWAQPCLCLIPSTSDHDPGLSSHILAVRSLPTCRHVTH